MSPIPEDPRAPRRTAQYSSSGAPQGALPPELSPRRGQRPPSKTGKAAPGAKKQKRRPARVLSWVAITMSIVVFLGCGLAWAAFMHFNGQIERITGITKGNTDNSPSVNYLVVGVDSREGDNSGIGGAGTVADVQGLRTDTMMLIHISKKAAGATIISFPRDSYVNIPGHGSTKLNAAVPLGGPGLLVQTLQQLTGLEIDHYIQVDFHGFLAMTDAVGGVDICLTQPAKDSYTGIDLSAGKHHIKGVTALAYVRQRYGLPQGDLDRIKRQQSFIGAMVREVTSAGTLLNPFKLTRFLDVATKAVKVDDHLTTSDMKTLAQRLRHLDPDHVRFETIPVRGTGLAGAAGSVVFLDTDKLPTFFGDIDNDVAQASPTPTPQVGSKPLTVPAGSITVNVLNGTGVTGKARSAADSLSAVGFNIATTGNASGGTYPKSIVRYGPSRADSARTLAAAVPGSVLEPEASLGSQLTLIVGQNFTGAKKVTIGPATPSTGGGGATATASPKPPVVTAANDACGV